MKKLQIITICVLLIMLAACRREDSLDTYQANPLLLGKWQLINLVEEYYQPVDVLMDHDEAPGEPGDSVIFKSDNQVSFFIDISPGEEEDIYPYEWINDSTIKIDGEHYTIRNLTANELTLYKDETKNNERNVETAYFTR